MKHHNQAGVMNEEKEVVIGKARTQGISRELLVWLKFSAQLHPYFLSIMEIKR